MKQKKKFIFWITLSILVILMLWQSFNQPGINDLESGFEEVASYRNDNNTGPVTRKYVVTTAQPENLKEMEAYGNLMPYTKLGETKVYFFDAGKPYPDRIGSEAASIPKEFEPYCLALYEKSFKGVRLLIRPFRDSAN